MLNDESRKLPRSSFNVGRSSFAILNQLQHIPIRIGKKRYAHVFETDVDHAARTFAAYLERADTDARLRQVDDSLGQ